MKSLMTHFPGCPTISPYMLAFRSSENLIAIIGMLSLIGLSVGVIILLITLAGMVRSLVTSEK